MSAEITNMPYDHKKYEDFMAKWKKESGYEDGNNKHFCEDGPIDDNKWEKSKSRIMFLLKESYSDFYIIRKNPCHGNMDFKKASAKRFWRNMRMSTYIIDEALANGGNVPSFPDTEKHQNDPNDSIAYVNLKKCVEKGKTSSNYYDIRNYVWRDADKLREQIDLINPRIIVCSGTYKYCPDLYDNLKKTAHEKLFLCEKENRYFIDFWHLSYWIISANDRHKKLRDIMEYIVKSA